MSDAPILTIAHAGKSYSRHVALDDVSLALAPGRITCLLGPSGCGKSTLLRLIAGLEPADAGEIAMAGALLSSAAGHVPPEQRDIGLVFQDFALFPHLDVTANVGFGIAHLARAERAERVAALLERFRLSHRAKAWPHTLSGGEQQRVAIARALARDPAVLLLDEPFSGLDGDLRAEVRRQVLDGLAETRAAVLIVTHDPEEAMLMADALALMRDGRVLQAGTPAECYARPVSIEAARLLGQVSVVPAVVRGGVAETPFGSLPADLPDGAARLMLRPEALALAEAGAPVTVTAARLGGGFSEIIVEAEGATASLRHAGGAPPIGRGFVRIDPARARLFAGS